MVKSALLGTCNLDNWFGLLQNIKSSNQFNLDFYSDIFRDLHNDTIPIIMKIHLLTYLEENALKLTHGDCFELVYCPLLVIFKNNFNSLKAPTRDLNKKNSLIRTTNDKQQISLNRQLYFHKIATCLTSLLLLSSPDEHIHSDQESVEEFINLLLDFSMTSTVIQLSSGSKVVGTKPDSVIIECLHLLQEHAGLVTKSQTYKAKQNLFKQTTLFAMLGNIDAFEMNTLESLMDKELNPHFVYAILKSVSEHLLKTQNLDPMIESKFSAASLKQLVSAFSGRKELHIVHIQIVLMFKSGLQLFSSGCEEQLIENLHEISFKTMIDVSTRLLALELLRDLSIKSIKTDLIRIRQLRPAQIDKPDTFEKKCCILCLSSLISDDEIFYMISGLFKTITSASTRAVNAFYRILSFTIAERPGLLERIEEIVFSLAEGPNKLINHALCLMEAQQTLIPRLTPRLIDYLISDFDSLSTKMDSYCFIKVFNWAINRDSICIEESKMLVLFTLISNCILARPKNYMEFLPLFTSILWSCEITPLLKAKMNKLFEQLMSNISDQTSVMWFEFYHTALNTFSETCKIRELDSCQPTYYDDEMTDKDSTTSIQKDLTCPIHLKRIDHTNYVSFPPTDINLELIFEMSLKDDLEHNFICDKIFAICVEIYSEDKKITLTTDLPILVKGENTAFKIMFRPISVYPFRLHFNFEFTDKDAKSFKFIDNYSCNIGLEDLLFPVSAEHNHPSRIKFNDLWQTVLAQQNSIETMIILSDFDDLDKFFQHFSWLNYYRIAGSTSNYFYDDHIEALCVMSKERYLLMRFGTANNCVKINILTNNYLIINHLFYELKGHTINS